MIWVVATSKHGSTGEVADAVAQELRHAGHDVERKDAEHVHGFEGADAMVLGSPIYGGRWLEAGRRLLPNQAEALSARPVWLFSDGPLGTRPRPTSPSRRNSSRAQRRSGRVSTACSAGGWTATSSGAASD